MLSNIIIRSTAAFGGAPFRLAKCTALGSAGAGAAKGAGIGAGIYKDHDEAFASLKKLAVIEPDEANRKAYLEAYADWKAELAKL